MLKRYIPFKGTVGVISCDPPEKIRKVLSSDNFSRLSYEQEMRKLTVFRNKDVEYSFILDQTKLLRQGRSGGLA